MLSVPKEYTLYSQIQFLAAEELYNLDRGVHVKFKFKNENQDKEPR